MQLFALFNVLDISLAEKKLVSLLCELSCPGVFYNRMGWTEEWLIEGLLRAVEVCLDEWKKKRKEKHTEIYKIKRLWLRSWKLIKGRSHFLNVDFRIESRFVTT